MTGQEVAWWSVLPGTHEEKTVWPGGRGRAQMWRGAWPHQGHPSNPRAGRRQQHHTPPQEPAQTPGGTARRHQHWREDPKEEEVIHIQNVTPRTAKAWTVWTLKILYRHLLALHLLQSCPSPTQNEFWTTKLKRIYQRQKRPRDRIQDSLPCFWLRKSAILSDKSRPKSRPRFPIQGSSHSSSTPQKTLRP